MWLIAPASHPPRHQTQNVKRKRSDQHQLSLARREKLASILSHQHILLHAQVAGLSLDAQLQRVDIAGLDDPLGCRAIARPARAEERAAVVAGAAQAMAESVLVFLISRVHNHIAG